MEQPDPVDLYLLINGCKLERIPHGGQWRLTWPHDGKTISRDLFIDRVYAESLVKALGA